MNRRLTALTANLLSATSALTLPLTVMLTLHSVDAGATASRSRSQLCRESLNPTQQLSGRTAFEIQTELQNAAKRQDALNIETPLASRAFGSDSLILHSFEKEGLFYEDIASWFPRIKDSGLKKLETRMRLELSNKSPRAKKLMNWLESIRPRTYPSAEIKSSWHRMSAEERLQVLLNNPEFFDSISVQRRSELFEEELINYDDLAPGPEAPKGVVVGDDLGSYEVRMNGAIANRTEYRKLRQQTEDYLGGKIGHQHLFFAWPKDSKTREAIAPYQVEMIDSAAWYLFWRQMKRDPEKIDSILTHPFLGVFTRSSLDRRYRAIVENQPKRFNDKFRMIGTRAFPPQGADPKTAPPESWVVDLELRSGNKGLKRDLVETTLEARLVSGDYSGLRDYREYDFDPSASIETIVSRFLSEGQERKNSQLKMLKEFESEHPVMSWSDQRTANNHIRNRVLSPLLPWENRLNLGFKKESVLRAQKEYAQALLRVARWYLDKSENESAEKVREIREEAVSKLEKAIFEFATKARLDQEFELYLAPTPRVFPSIQVRSTGPIDVNRLGKGLEYSFRFAMKPGTRAEAARMISTVALEVAKAQGAGAIEAIGGDGHGHGVVSKFKVTDRQGQAWRFEWDGIQRSYINGKVQRARGGHMEVATPKFTPESIEGSIAELYQTARRYGMVPKRSAGGAHLTTDVGMIREILPPEKAARAVLNMAAYFESNRDLVLSLWMHPMRRHAAYPIELGPDFAKAVSEFRGDMEDLGRMLYEQRYFNPYVGRKPKYVPLNFTPLMTRALPSEYVEKNLDIKNPKSEWFPHFSKVYDRVEARFFDAPVNEMMAALQIKYWRALENHTLNSQLPIQFSPRFSPDQVEVWKMSASQWMLDVSTHLRELGLDPAEFEALIWSSWEQMKIPPRQHELKRFEKFQPAAQNATAPSDRRAILRVLPRLAAA